ncbi:MAG: DUF4115 domain-containing protein [Gammaproteobacteria bacterium]|nr:DUF4115 domain-containing protein [Gammaproteobacteria bacterium]MDP2140623.1 DUF4115 domain-containing protein [Gammaproteobacteria bacterium]MDP2347395.1 DUF4115 domain-containing protein [Gammaproteobacteria bacterium]
MNSEENNEELRPPEQSGSDEPVVDDMSVDNIATVVTQDDDSPIGPGQLLSRKREALGMTVQQVADELHITMHYVRALESNAHDKLPGDVFVRGYLRSYANLLKMDPVVLINVYNEFANLQASAAQQANSSKARRRKDRNLPWIIVSGIAFVGIAIALWYFNTRASSITSSPTPVQSTANSISAQAVVPAPALSNGSTPTIDNVATTLVVDTVSTSSATALEPTDITPPATTPAPSTSALTMPSQQLNATQSAETADATAIISTIAVAEETVAPVQGAPTVEFSVSASTSAAGSASANAENVPVPSAAPASSIESVPEPTPNFLPESASEPINPSPQASIESRIISIDAGGQDLVQITFNGESMVQVEDGSDKQIYRDTRTSGDVLRITGSAPFNILLSDAASTELSLNGNSIDFTSNIRIDNSARLTIGL